MKKKKVKDTADLGNMGCLYWVCARFVTTICPNVDDFWSICVTLSLILCRLNITGLNYVRLHYSLMANKIVVVVVVVDGATGTNSFPRITENSAAFSGVKREEVSRRFARWRQCHSHPGPRPCHICCCSLHIYNYMQFNFGLNASFRCCHTVAIVVNRYWIAIGFNGRFSQKNTRRKFDWSKLFDYLLILLLHAIYDRLLAWYCRLPVCLSVCDAVYCGAQGQCRGWKL